MKRQAISTAAAYAFSNERDTELEQRKQAAYERGEAFGYSNKSFAYAEQLGYRPNSDEHLAFLDGYEDGQNMQERN